jgi:IS30 family transposase
MRRGWSPEQIAGKLKRLYPDDVRMHVSHETIYAHIYAYPLGSLRTELIKLLRKHRKKRMPRARGKDRRGQLRDIISIAARPKDVETRAVPGHWEGDLINLRVLYQRLASIQQRRRKQLQAEAISKSPTMAPLFGIWTQMGPSQPKPINRAYYRLLLLCAIIVLFYHINPDLSIEK